MSAQMSNHLNNYVDGSDDDGDDDDDLSQDISWTYTVSVYKATWQPAISEQANWYPLWVHLSVDCCHLCISVTHREIPCLLYHAMEGEDCIAVRVITSGVVTLYLSSQVTKVGRIVAPLFGFKNATGM